MTLWISVIARWIHGVALGLWLGGLIAIGAFVAATAFHDKHIEVILVSHAIAQRDIAGLVVGESLRKFNVLCIVCGLLMLLSSALFARRGADRRTRSLSLFSAAVTFVLLALTIYQKQILFPALDLAQAQQQWPVFDRLHHLYEGLSRLQMPFLLFIALLVALRDTFSPSTSSPK